MRHSLIERSNYEAHFVRVFPIQLKNSPPWESSIVYANLNISQEIPLQDLAPCFRWLPGFTGPVPPPLWMFLIFNLS